MPQGTVKPAPQKNTLYENFDEQVIFTTAQGQPVEGRLRFLVEAPSQPDLRLSGDSPPQGMTERLSTDAAGELQNALRYARFKFDT